MPERAAHTTSNMVKVEQVLVGAWNAVKPESQGKKVLEYYDKFRFPKFAREDKKVADKIHVFLKKHPTLVGSGAIVGEAAIVAGVVIGFRKLREAHHRKNITSSNQKDSARSSLQNMADAKEVTEREALVSLLREFMQAKLDRPDRAVTDIEERIVQDLPRYMDGFNLRHKNDWDRNMFPRELLSVLRWSVQETPDKVPYIWKRQVARAHKDRGLTVVDVVPRAAVQHLFEANQIWSRSGLSLTLGEANELVDYWEEAGWPLLMHILRMSPEFPLEIPLD